MFAELSFGTKVPRGGKIPLFVPVVSAFFAEPASVFFPGAERFEFAVSFAAGAEFWVESEHCVYTESEHCMHAEPEHCGRAGAEPCVQIFSSLFFP